MMSRHSSFAWLTALFFLAATFALSTVAWGADKSNTHGTISKHDQRFVDMAWNINTAEVELGKIAQDKASHADVKAFGQRMIEDHRRLNHELRNLAKEHSATLPRKLDRENKHLIDRLSKLSGAKFDKEYMKAMIEGHRHAVAAFGKESKRAAQTATDKWAGRTLETLKEHLQLAEKTGKEVGA